MMFMLVKIKLTKLVSFNYLTFYFLAGLTSEGLYRVAGFHDDVEAIKMAFDKGEVTIIRIF